MPEAATPTGGAEGAARPEVSVHDRLKAALYPSEPAKETEEVAPEQHAEPASASTDKPAAKQAPAKVEKPEVKAGPAEEEAETEIDDDAVEPQSLEDLAAAIGWDVDKLLGLNAKTKIDGKEGSRSLRDLVKSHQLEGHLNQGLMKLAEERKAFEAETGRKVNEFQARIGQLNQAVGLAQKILDGEFADVNWQELQRTDPAAFQAKYGAYKMRLDGIQQLNAVVGQETERTRAEHQAAQKAYLDDQAKLLDSKIPEWSDKGKRDKDVAEMAAILTDAYGITEQELKACVDHRQILLARDAVSWQRLQKSKPAMLNKVKAAPKLLKPGTSQSRAQQENAASNAARDNLRRTGKVRDAAEAFKRLGIV